NDQPARIPVHGYNLRNAVTVQVADDHTTQVVGCLIFRRKIQRHGELREGRRLGLTQRIVSEIETGAKRATYTKGIVTVDTVVAIIINSVITYLLRKCCYC